MSTNITKTKRTKADKLTFLTTLVGSSKDSSLLGIGDGTTSSINMSSIC